MKKFTVGIIISTYNNPKWLEKTLWSYAVQSVAPDEIIIADDGSDDITRRLIEKYSETMLIKHIWHEDKGFRKTVILNKALCAATSDYLIFTDQDCVARYDFIETHIKFAQKGYLLSGGYNKLSMKVSNKITCDDVLSRRAFRFWWLLLQGQTVSFKCTKLFNNKWFSAFMNFITPTKATWNGMNSSGWRSDILAVKGFDERMQYGGEDREMGERLVNNGIKCKQIRYSAVLLHLDHSRPYVSKEAIEKNNAIRRETRRKRITVTEYGLK